MNETLMTDGRKMERKYGHATLPCGEMDNFHVDVFDVEHSSTPNRAVTDKIHKKNNSNNKLQFFCFMLEMFHGQLSCSLKRLIKHSLLIDKSNEMSFI